MGEILKGGLIVLIISSFPNPVLSQSDLTLTGQSISELNRVCSGENSTTDLCQSVKSILFDFENANYRRCIKDINRLYQTSILRCNLSIIRDKESLIRSGNT